MHLDSLKLVGYLSAIVAGLLPTAPAHWVWVEVSLPAIQEEGLALRPGEVPAVRLLMHFCQHLSGLLPTNRATVFGCCLIEHRRHAVHGALLLHRQAVAETSIIKALAFWLPL